MAFDRDPEAITCVQRAGDVFFVPANWGHAVRNDEDSVGAALEFVDSFMVHWLNTQLLPAKAIEAERADDLRREDADLDDADDAELERRAMLADLMAGPGGVLDDAGDLR